jgi:hypothetical protein
MSERQLTGDETSERNIDPEIVQEIARALAFTLSGMREILILCHRGLSVSKYIDQMREGALPPDLSAGLRGDIEVVVNQHLPELTDILNAMSTESAERLAADWESRPRT